jgi:hypothetical protein
MRRLVILATIVALTAPLGASADHPLGNIPWPDLLPPLPGVPAPSHPAEPCGPAPQPSCVDGVIADMVAGWEPLDHACDERAVFALTYLITTEAFRTFLSDAPNGPFFADEAAIIQLDREFADLYFAAFEGYGTGTAPPAWRIAFDAATQNRTNAVQDVFLGMNAHIQRDLPVALAAVGLVDTAGRSRKPDHDRVNQILSGVLDEIEDEIARRYDSSISFFDASPSPVDEVGSLELLKSWRELAWRNAERLTLARTATERAVVMAQIEAYSQLWATLIAAPDSSFYSATRTAYCEERLARPPGGTMNANAE